MKIETAELQFIRADNETRHFAPGEKGDFLCEDPEHETVEQVYTWLIEEGMLTPDPLQKALSILTTVEEKWENSDDNPHYGIGEVLETAREAIHTLYEDMK